MNSCDLNLGLFTEQVLDFDYFLGVLFTVFIRYSG